MVGKGGVKSGERESGEIRFLKSPSTLPLCKQGKKENNVV
jgi:hypothetical protein